MRRSSCVPFIGLCFVLLMGSKLRADTCATLPPATTQDFQSLLQAFLDNNCYKRWPHDPQIRSTNGVHPNVQVYYSPGIWAWMIDHRRRDEVPEGAMLIKEQYGDATHPTTLTDWAIMIKNRAGAWDGWYWADLVPTASQLAEPPPAFSSNVPTCQKPALPYAGFGQYCIDCHASARQGQNTFATTRFVRGLILTVPLLNLPPEDNIHFRLSHRPRLESSTPNNPVCMVPEQNDHVVVDGKPLGPQKFITSDQCTGCHNATATLSPARIDLPSMLYYTKLPSEGSSPETVNLSPNGEWRFSMMGLAGRDPIFFSQLNSEISLHDNLRDHPGQGKEFVQDLCLHCHAVMGQRQYHDDTGKYFTRDHLQDSASLYGALGRDGVSCTVCHRIAAEGLGQASTFTGNFNLEPPNQVNGPYDNPLKLPMKNALGMTPKFGTQIENSELCGSCHTIILPVYRANGKPVMDKRTGQQKTFAEQATFFEWQNSNFADNGLTPRSCQDCHMPDTFRHNGEDKPLAFKIANIEDDTFPAVDFRAPDRKIALRTRDDYHRHTLLGINVFALEMFKQFRTELGLYDQDPMMRPSLNTNDSVDTAIDMSANVIARTETAEVKILSATRSRDEIKIDVRVTNKAGHSFPSGVGFRRAFLNLQVLDQDGKIVWASGNLAPRDSSLPLKGMIVDGAGQPLTTEIFTPDQQRIQPHFWRDNPITRQNQVQIYEELVTNPEGYLTTSFVALDRKVKDNRLQPQGWNPEGPAARETSPVGTCLGASRPRRCDPNYQDGSGSNVVRYLVSLTPRTRASIRVRATLYYQAIPPYYQLQRRTDASGLDTDRFVRFVNDLQVNKTAIKRWALPIDSDKAEISWGR